MRLKLNEKTECVFADGHADGAFGCLRSILMLALLLLGFLPPTLFAQPRNSKPSQTSNRFLFIIDTSAAMKGLQQDEMKVVYELLASSATGQMHSGDSVGLWTFNQDVHSELPAQTLTAENQNQIIQRTMSYLQQQRYAKTSRLNKALSDMQDVVQASDIITVFIISNGHGKMAGTPFDKEINALYKQSLADMKHDPKPVITVLQAKGGKLVHFTVNAMPWPVVVPEIPIPIRAAQPLPTEANTAAPNQTASSPANAPIILPAQSSAPPTPTTPQTATQPTPLPQQSAPAQTPAAPAVANPPPLPSASPPPVLRKQYSGPVVDSAPPSQSPTQNATQPNPPKAPQQTTTAPNTSPTDVIASNGPPTQKTPPLLPTVKEQPAPLPTPTTANDNEHSTPVSSPQSTSSSNTASSNPANLAVTPAESQPSSSNQAPTNAAPVAQSKTNAQTETAAPATNSLSSRAYAFVSPGVNARPKSLLIAGLALLALALILIVVMVSRSRATSGPSLISQTMGNGQKK